MFVRVVKSGPRKYLRLVENFREKKSGKVRQRTLANLFRFNEKNGTKILDIEDWTDNCKNHKLKIVRVECKNFGKVCLLQKIWDDLHLDNSLSAVLYEKKKSNLKKSIALIRLMVFQEICEPGSKLSCLKWLEKVEVPRIKDRVSYQSLIRVMDNLSSKIEEFEEEFEKNNWVLTDDDLTLALFDMSKNHLQTKLDKNLHQLTNHMQSPINQKQSITSIILNSDGLPVICNIHNFKKIESKSVFNTVESIIENHSINRIVSVADRILLSAEEVNILVDREAKKGKELQFILGIPESKKEKIVVESEKLKKFRKNHSTKNAITIEFRKKDQKYSNCSDHLVYMMCNVKNFPDQIIDEYHKFQSELEYYVHEIEMEFNHPFRYLNLPSQNKNHSIIYKLASLLLRHLHYLIKENHSTHNIQSVFRLVKDIRLYKVNVNGTEFIGVSKKTKEQSDLFKQINVRETDQI